MPMTAGAPEDTSSSATTGRPLARSVTFASQADRQMTGGIFPGGIASSIKVLAVTGRALPFSSSRMSCPALPWQEMCSTCTSPMPRAFLISAVVAKVTILASAPPAFASRTEGTILRSSDS